MVNLLGVNISQMNVIYIKYVSLNRIQLYNSTLFLIQSVETNVIFVFTIYIKLRKLLIIIILYNYF